MAKHVTDQTENPFASKIMENPNNNPVIIDVETAYLPRSGKGFSLGHPLVWLAITLGFLAIGYIWLSVYAGDVGNTTTVNPVKKLAPADAALKVMVNPVKKQDEMTITREDDAERASEYLAYESVEQQILPLLDAADVQFENEQYVTPPGNNAWESYEAILRIEPEESIAIAGKTKIKSRLISNAEQAIDSGAYEEAENWLTQLDLVQPDDALQASLRDEISTLIAADAEQKLLEQAEEEKQQKITTALAQAEEEFASDKPNYNKIRDLYDRANELDQGNAEAQRGLAKLADIKLDEVENALREGSLDQATEGLKQAKAIYPESKRIGSLQLALDVNLKQQQEAERIAAEKEQAEKASEETVAKPEPANEPVTPEKPDDENATEVASTGVTTTVTNALSNQSASGVIGKPAATPPAKIVTGIIGLDKAAKPKVKTESPSLIKGIRAYYDGEYAKSFELLYPLAQEGVPRAQFRIGIMYQFGRSVAKNVDLAEKWFTAALPQLLRQSQQGIAWAQTDLGTAYEFGISLQQDYERAAHWYQQAAEQGYAGAQTNLGVLYAQGDGVPYNRSKAIEWLKKAAAQGDRVANENLGILGVN